MFVLKHHLHGNGRLVFGSNSGGGRTRLHARSIACFTIVDPSGACGVRYVAFGLLAALFGLTARHFAYINMHGGRGGRRPSSSISRQYPIVPTAVISDMVHWPHARIIIAVVGLVTLALGSIP